MDNQHSNKKKLYTYLIIALCVGLLFVLAMIFYWLKPKSEQKSSNNTTTPVSATSVIVNNLPASIPLSTIVSAPATTPLPPLPHSLQGTQVDGEIIIDENKNLVVTKGLRRMFDYFLSAQGEETLEIIHKRVADYIRSHTPEPASSQALTLYFNYIKYLDGVANIEQQFAPNKPPANPQDMDFSKIIQRQTAVSALQKSLFDDKTVKAFFGEENALNTYTMATMQASKNTTLTDEQREQAFATAKQQYMNSFDDSELKAQLEQQGNIEKLLQETQKLKAQGASQEQLNAMRRKYVDEKAVQRLNKLDQEENNFDNKFMTYQSQRDAILASQGNTPAAQKAIEQLQKQHFNDLEIKRLDGYEAVKKSQVAK